MILVTCDGPSCRMVQPPDAVFQNPQSEWIVRSGIGGNGVPNHFCSADCEVAYALALKEKLASVLAQQREVEPNA